jgi:NifU-like protein involved in Fe-S cluster formation
MDTVTYTERVTDHAQHPRNFGPLENPDGFGRVESPCGDWVEMRVQLDADRRLATVKFLCFGCASALATGSVITELAAGKTLPEARELAEDDVLRYLGGLPEEKTHCNTMSLAAFRAAIEDAMDRSA